MKHFNIVFYGANKQDMIFRTIGRGMDSHDALRNAGEHAAYSVGIARFNEHKSISIEEI